MSMNISFSAEIGNNEFEIEAEISEPSDDFLNGDLPPEGPDVESIDVYFGGALLDISSFAFLTYRNKPQNLDDYLAELAIEQYERLN